MDVEPLAPVLELRPPGSEPVSPELVLIDPELARRERARLRAPAPVRASSAEVGRPTPLRAAPAPAHRPSPRAAPTRRRHYRIVVWATALALGVLGLQYVLQHDSPQPILGDAPVRTAARTANQPPSAAPPTGPPPRQSIGLGATTVRTLAWAPVPGATRYELQLYRGSKRVLIERTRSTRFTLPERWRHAGRVVRLEPGRYRWNVWALSSGGKLDPKPVVQAQILIAAR